MREKVKEDNRVIDIHAAKGLMRINPMKVYTVKLEDGMVVDIRLHPVGAPIQKGETEKFKPAKEGFRQAWKEAMTEKNLPLSELWTDIENN